MTASAQQNVASSLEELPAATAGALRQRLEPGGRVGLYMHNNPDYYTVLFAIWCAGLVALHCRGHVV